MNSEVEDCLIRLENQMYGFGGVAGRSASSDRYAVKEHIRDVEGYERDARRDVVQKDARIAELTADVSRYKDALAEIIALNDRYVMSGLSADEMANIARNALKEGL